MDKVRTRVKFWLLDSDGTVLLEEVRSDLLRQIRELGSIAAAACQMEISYPTARYLVDGMNAKLPAVVMRTQQGGSGGDKAELTPIGEIILNEFCRIEEEFDQLLAMKAEAFSSRAEKAARLPPLDADG